MSKLSVELQAESLKAMTEIKPYEKALGSFRYTVLPKVYKGSTDTALFCDVLDVRKGEKVWDIGTGTGLIALRAKQMGASRVLATDLNPHAVENAKANSKLLGLDIEVKKANLFGDNKEKFDVITFNPPFTDHAPKEVHDISFWDKGNETVKRFLREVKGRLNPRGRVFIAWSSFGDVRKLKKFASDLGLTLKEVGRRKGKRNFTYYVFKIEV